MPDVEKPPSGLECPDCGSCMSSVFKTRRFWGRISRERVCGHCGTRWSTTERSDKRG